MTIFVGASVAFRFGQGALLHSPLWLIERDEEINEEMDIETELLYTSRMILAAVIGGLIGLERERHASDAGIRTFMAISMRSCAFSLISVHVGGDSTRIAAQIVTGIGFIGAGVIFQDKEGVAGLW